MTTNRNNIDQALAKAGLKHLGEEQVQCECGQKFWMASVNIALAKQLNIAILCPACKRATIADAIRASMEGPD
jgi:hypothetical protein